MLRRSIVILRSRTVSAPFLGRRLATVAAPKKEGDISDSFVSLSGGSQPPLPDRYRQLKIDRIHGREEAVLDSWKRLLRELRHEYETVIQKGSSVIPHIDAKELKNGLSTSMRDEILKRGVVVVKGVVPEKEARAYKDEVEEYVRRNPHTRAFPQHDPQVYELYWSPPQLKARSHPSLMAVQRQLMTSFWNAAPEAEISLTQPITFADRLRIRRPGDANFALGPHIDGGSVERWETEGYGDVYDDIFAGRWEEYDPWDATQRINATSDTHNGLGSCSVFRMWQGWLSMSSVGPGEGTLLVNPVLKLSTAYLLLRPFFKPRKEMKGPEFLEEDNWSFVGVDSMTSELQGATPGHGQELSEAMHPHLRLGKSMVHIPKVKAGDYVAWHCDSIHAVDKIHAGTSDSSVLYIPVCPLTTKNADFLARQRETFRTGTPGPDYPGGEGESRHVGRLTEDGLAGGEEGLRAMGLGRFVGEGVGDGEARVVRRANGVLGFAR